MRREQQLENAWQSGDSAAASAVLRDGSAALLTPAALADNDLATFWPCSRST